MFLFEPPLPGGQIFQGVGKLGFALAIAVTLVGCNDDPEIIDEPEQAGWLENGNFQFDLKNQYNSYASEEALFVLGRNTLTTIEQHGEQLTYENAILWLDYNLNHRMPISDRVFVTANDSRVRFASTRNPVLNRSDVFLSMQDIDPEFTGFDFPGFDFGEAMGIDTRQRVLIPYYSNDEVPFETNYRLLLVQLEVRDDEGSDRLDTLSTTILPAFGPFIAINEFNDNFYITYPQGTFLLDQFGALSSLSVNRPFYKMFAVGDLLFGVYDNELYQSQDGVVWSLAATNETLRLLGYQQVGDMSIGFYNSQLFLFETEVQSLQITELDNEGLEGHEITSVSLLGETVFVTTFSGVFQKPLAEFDIPKEEESTGS